MIKPTQEEYQRVHKAVETAVRMGWSIHLVRGDERVDVKLSDQDAATVLAALKEVVGG